MASSSTRIITTCLLLVAVAMVSSLAGAEKQNPPLIAKGLSFDYYKTSCPQAESIVFSFLQDAIHKDIGLAAALLRLHFHDCFVQGCDASILLDALPNEQSEKEALPNVTLRKSAFKAINDIRDRLEEACGGLVVSCADIVTLAARDSVHLAGGPWYDVPLGRFDGLKYASQEAVFDALPPPSSNVTTLLSFLDKIKLDADDLVALSGAHTLGIAHCNSLDDRLFPTQDDTMDKWFAGHLKLTCPVKDTDNTTANDIRTPNVFDNKYYVDLLNRQGLFTSDQVLNIDARTKHIVTEYAVDQNAFFKQFKISMVKMGQIQVLHRTQGQIRKNCSVRNAAGNNNLLPWSVVETIAEAAAESMM